MSNTINLAPIGNIDEDKNLSNTLSVTPTRESSEETLEEEKAKRALSAQMAQNNLNNNVQNRSNDIEIIKNKENSDIQVEENLKQADSPSTFQGFLDAFATGIMQTPPGIMAAKTAINTHQTRGLFEEDRGGVLTPKFFNQDKKPNMTADQILSSYYSVGDIRKDRAFYDVVNHPSTVGVLTARDINGAIIAGTIRDDGKFNPAAALQIAREKYNESDGASTNFVGFTKNADADMRFSLLAASKAKVVITRTHKDDEYGHYTDIPGYGPGYYLFTPTTDFSRNAYLRSFLNLEGDEHAPRVDERTQAISDYLINTDSKYADMLDNLVPDVADRNRILAIAARGAREANQSGIGMSGFAASMYNTALNLVMAAGVSEQQRQRVQLSAVDQLLQNPEAAAVAMLSTEMFIDTIDTSVENFRAESIVEKFADEAQIPLEDAQRIFSYNNSFREIAVKLLPETAGFYGIFKAVGTASTKGAYKAFQEYVRKQPEFLNDSDDEILRKFELEEGLYDKILARHIDEVVNGQLPTPLELYRRRKGTSGEALRTKILRGSRLTDEGLEEIEEQTSKNVASLLKEAEDIQDLIDRGGRLGQDPLSLSELAVLNVKKNSLVVKASYEEAFGVAYKRFDDLGSEVISYAGATAALTAAENFYLTPDVSTGFFTGVTVGSEISGAVLAPILFNTARRPLTATSLNAAIDFADFSMGFLLGGSKDRIKFKDVFKKMEKNEAYEQGLKIYDIVFKDMTETDRVGLFSEANEVNSFIDDILKIRDPDTGQLAFQRDDIQLTLGAVFNSPVLNSLFQATRGVTDIKDQYGFGKTLSTQSDLIDRQRKTRDKLQEVLGRVVNPSEDLSEEGQRIFKILEEQLNRQTVILDMQVQQFNQAREKYFDYLKLTIGINREKVVKEVPSSKAAFEAFERDFKVKNLGPNGLPDIKQIEDFNARLLELQTAAKENWNSQLDTFLSGKAAYGNKSIEEHLFDYHVGLEKTDYQNYKSAYDLVDTKHSDVYVDGFNFLSRIRSGRAYEYIDSKEIYGIKDESFEIINKADGDSVSVLVNKMAAGPIPQERQYMVLMEGAAYRFFAQRAGEEAANKMRQNIIEAYNDLSDEVKEVYPLTHGRNIDVWEWQKNYFSKESFDNVPDELKSLFGFTDEIQMRNYADSMQLPLSFKELNNIDSIIGKAKFAASQANNKEREIVLGGIRDSIEFERANGLRYLSTGELIDNAKKEALTSDLNNARTLFKVYQKRHSSRDITNKNNPLVKGQETDTIGEHMSTVLNKLETTSSPTKFFENQEGRHLTKLFGEWDEATGRFYIIEGSQGAEDLKKLMKSSFLVHMLGTRGGDHVTSLANLDPAKQPLGVYMTHSGVVQYDKIAKEMLGETVIENPVQLMRAMESIPTYTRNASGEIEVTGVLFKETDEYFPIGRYENIEDIPFYDQKLAQGLEELDVYAKEAETEIRTYVNVYKNRVSQFLKVVGKEGNFEDILYENAITDKGRMVINSFRNNLPESEHEAFDTLVSLSIRRGTFNKLRVTDGTDLDILKLDKLFSDDRALEALREVNPNMVKSLESVKKFTDRVYPPDHPLRLTGKPLPFNIESGFNKLWQVMRHQASFRWLALEALFRTGRKKKYDAFVSMIGDPEVSDAFLQILEAGVQPKTAVTNRALERLSRAMTRNILIERELSGTYNSMFLKDGDITQEDVERRDDLGRRGFQIAPQQEALYGGPRDMIDRLNHINKNSVNIPTGVTQ